MLNQWLPSLFYKPGYRPDENREGKSGQHKATHRLIAGPDASWEDSATENNRLNFWDKGENVR